MICIFAEKFDVGIKIAVSLGNVVFHGNKITDKNVEKYKTQLEKEIKPIGFIDIEYNGSDYCVTWGNGHLCQLKQARDYDSEYVSWSKMPIPFFPENYQIKVKEGPDKKPAPWILKQINVVRQKFKECDSIINATDDDREGELIFAYVYQYIGVKKPYKRVVIDSQTKEGYINAFSHLKMSSEVKPVENAGRARSIADWVVGANLTAAMSVKYRGLISIGRVQTPVLNFIVSREKEIQNFKSHPFWYLVAEFSKENGEKYLAKHSINQIEKKEEALSLLNKIKDKESVVSKYEKKEKTKEVPLLYNFSNLAIDANRAYGISSDKTLEIIQELYMSGYISYPRTESMHLTDDMQEIVDQTIDMLSTLPEYKDFISPVPKNERNYTKRHFDTKKVESHYAIIPTNNVPKSLEGDKKNVYDLIAKSLIRIIYKPAILEDTKVETVVDGEVFKSSGLAIKDPQWLVVGTSGKERFLPSLEVGEVVSGKYLIKEGKTEPPQRYTDATLMTAMVTAGKNIENKELRKVLEETNNGGIGRGSTRAGIIKTVVERYATRKGKYIIPTENSMKLIDILPLDDVKSAEMTAEWEKRLDKIAHSEETIDNFVKDIEQQTKDWCSKIKDQETSFVFNTAKEQQQLSVNCPICGKPLIKSKFSYCCSDYNNCKFKVPLEVCGAKISAKDVESLIKKKKTSAKSLTSKEGKKFSGFLVLKEDNSIGLSFGLDLKCPKCGKQTIKDSPKAWSCSDCDFVIWNTIAGRTISAKEKKQLINKGKTDVLEGFKSKAGKEFSASLMLDSEKKVVFDFGATSKRNKKD